MALVVDPLGSGLVQSLSRPGGNVTGLSMMTTDLNSKRLQLLKDIRQILRVPLLADHLHHRPHSLRRQPPASQQLHQRRGRAGLIAEKRIDTKNQQ